MNRIVKFRVKGDYAHFKIPYTNNNPLTHSLITKTALIGIIGAVVGIERKEMKRWFPVLSESLAYSVRLNAPLRKESVSMYMVNFDNYFKNRPTKSPKPMEFIKNPDYTIFLLLRNKEKEVEEIFERFIYHLEEGVYIWNPTLGIKNCPCTISEVEAGEAELMEGEFSTFGFVRKLLVTENNLKIYSDKVPVFQDEEWFNDPDRYVSIKFTDKGSPLKSQDHYYQFKEENLYMI